MGLKKKNDLVKELLDRSSTDVCGTRSMHYRGQDARTIKQNIWFCEIQVVLLFLNWRTHPTDSSDKKNKTTTIY